MNALKEELVSGFARVHEVHDISTLKDVFLFVHLSAEKNNTNLYDVWN